MKAAWVSGPDRTTFPTSWIRGISTALPRSQSVVLIYLMTWVGTGKSETWTGVRRIARETGLSVRSVERGLSGLKAAGLIRRVRRRMGKTALTCLNVTEIENLESGGSVVTETAHAPDLTQDPPKVADQDPPKVADQDPPDLADERRSSKREEEGKRTHGRPRATPRRIPEVAMETEEDGSMLDSPRVPRQRKKRAVRVPAGANKLASVLREEMAVKWAGQTFPSVDMKERGVWKNFSDGCGEEAALATIRWVVRNWDRLTRDYKIQGYPSAQVIMGFRQSWVPEATASAQSKPETSTNTPELGW